MLRLDAKKWVALFLLDLLNNCCSILDLEEVIDCIDLFESLYIYVPYRERHSVGEVANEFLQPRKLYLEHIIFLLLN